MRSRESKQQWWMGDSDEIEDAVSMQEPIVLGWGEALTPVAMHHALNALIALREAHRTATEPMVYWKHHQSAARHYLAAVGTPLADGLALIPPEAFQLYEGGLMSKFDFRGDELDAMIDDLARQNESLTAEE